jgi:hypothetical protein
LCQNELFFYLIEIIIDLENEMLRQAVFKANCCNYVATPYLMERQKGVNFLFPAMGKVLPAGASLGETADQM